jgi:flagellar biosynthesis regulator FlaF
MVSTLSAIRSIFTCQQIPALVFSDKLWTCFADDVNLLDENIKIMKKNTTLLDVVGNLVKY